MWFHPRVVVIHCAQGGVTEKLQLLHSQIKTVLYKSAVLPSIPQMFTSITL